MAFPDRNVSLEQLDAYAALGGNGFHLHAEGDDLRGLETTGRWLSKRDHTYFTCAQVIHNAWDDARNEPIERYYPEAITEDVEEMIALMKLPHLDAIYWDDRPHLDFMPVLESVWKLRERGRIHHLGLRTVCVERLREMNAACKDAGEAGIAALITTELATATPTSTLWPEYVPFDNSLKQIAEEEEITVFAHVEDMNIGQCLFEDHDEASVCKESWITRWQNDANKDFASNLLSESHQLGVSTRKLNVERTLRQTFATIGMVSNSAAQRTNWRDYVVS